MFSEIVWIFAAGAGGFSLYVLLRSLALKARVPKGQPLWIFLMRLSLPVALVAVAAFLRIAPVRRFLFPTERFHPFLDAALVFFFIFLLVRFVDALLLVWFAHRHREFPLPDVLHSLILAVFYLVILFVILKGTLGINITPFLATSAILTMILGLAFQGVLSNILSGMSLHFTRSFSKSDWVKIGEDEGIVVDTNWRETRIFDRFSNIIVLPNNLVASEKITNFSSPGKKTALSLPVKAGYDAPPASVIEALKEAAADVPEVLTTPAPEVHILGYEDFGVSYLLKYWVSNYARKYAVLSDVGRLVWYKFKRRGIAIPFPLTDSVAGVLRSMERGPAPGPLQEEREENFQDLMASSFLRAQEGPKKGALLVSEEAVRNLASSVRRGRFTPGEVLCRQGERGESCYIVARGKIRGEILYQEKDRTYKSEFMVEKGSLFGEMSLFTGMPRTATGIVEEESVLLEVTLADFSRLLGNNPGLAEVIADLVSRRNRKNRAFLEKVKELSEREVKASTSKRSVLTWLKSLISRRG